MLILHLLNMPKHTPLITLTSLLLTHTAQLLMLKLNRATLPGRQGVLNFPWEVDSTLI